MFLINLTQKTLEFRAHNDVLFLKPGVNYVNDNKFNAGEVKNHFGNLVTFVSEQDAKGDAEAPEPIAPVEDVKVPIEEVEETIEAPVEEISAKEIVEEIKEEVAEAPVEEVKEEAPKAKANKTARQTKKTNKK